MSFKQQGQKCILSAKEYLFYTWNRAEEAELEYPCCIKLHSVSSTMRSLHIKIFILASLNFELYGDFGSEQSELIIFHANGIKKAKLDTKGVGSVEMPVDKEGEIAFTKFLQSVKAAEKEGGCTTKIHCSVYTSSETIEKKDIDCSWEGFRGLKSVLFKKD
jgi:hypothetical protein